MKWNAAFALGILTLGRLAAAAQAGDPPPAAKPAPVVPAALVADQPESKTKLAPPAGNPEPVSVFNDLNCDQCSCACAGWYWQAGVGVYVLQPFFEKDQAFTTSIYKGTGVYDPAGNGSTTSTQTTTTTTTSSGGAQTTTNHTDEDNDHWHRPPWDKDKDRHPPWHDGFWPPWWRRWHPGKDDRPDCSSSTSSTTTSSSQTTSTTTTTQNSTTDPKPSASGNGAGLTSRQDFGHHLDVSPLIWIGVANNDGLGFRARWWQLQDSSGAQIVNGDPTGATEITSASPLGLSISSPSRTLADGAGADVWLFHRELKLVVWDVEATQSLDVGRWALVLTGGARYAHVAQNYSAVRSNSGPDLAAGLVVQQDSSTLLAGHNFNGAGPMAAIEARCPIADTGLLLYGSARGSILFGVRKQNVSTEDVYAGTLADHTPFNLRSAEAATTHGDALLPVMELEVGVEYGRPVGRLYPFIRTGLVSQVWFGAGNSSSTDGNFGFLGLEAALGCNF